MRAGGGYGKLFVTAVRNGDRMKVTYSDRDSISKHYLTDPLFKPLFDSTRYTANGISKVDRDKAFSSMRSLVDRYSYFTTDSVEVNLRDHDLIVKHFERIDSAPVDQLGDKNRIVLDGSLHVFDFVGPGGTKTIEASSPTRVSHPVLMELVEELLKLR